MKHDDETKPLVYPSAVAYDSVLKELYVVNGGSSRIVVYGPDYFPRISIGAGRGIISPTAVAVTAKGEVYVCQVRTSKNPAARITILNGAFFVDREILLEQIPEAASFVPKHVALSREGFIYLVGENSRGVLVLDDEGIFLRWLKPIDKIYPRNLPKDVPASKGNQGNQQSTETAEVAEAEDPFADIPEEFRPRTSSSSNGAGGTGKVDGPVLVNFLTFDSNGNIYLVSNETGKVYVYGPDEDFLFSFGDKGGSPGQMSQPRALAIDERQEIIYVADYMRHTVLVFSLDGEYLFEIGGRGMEPGWYNFPTAMAINKRGQIIVADLFNGRVQVLEMAYKEWRTRYEIESDLEIIAEEISAEEISEQAQLTPGQPETVAFETGELATVPVAVEFENRDELELLTDSAAETPAEKLAQLIGRTDQPLEIAATPATAKLAALLAADSEVIGSAVSEPSNPQAESTSAVAGAAAFVEAWAENWQSKNLTGYLASYSPDFEPVKMTRDAWHKQRVKRVGGGRKIKIDISEMEIETRAPGRVKVSFVQKYSSANYADVTHKVLELSWEDDRWAIRRETVLDQHK